MSQNEMSAIFVLKQLPVAHILLGYVSVTVENKSLGNRIHEADGGVDQPLNYTFNHFLPDPIVLVLSLHSCLTVA